MSPTQGLFPLAFLGIFQALGGLGLGSGLRTLVVNRSPRGIGFIVWGLLFGGIPALSGFMTEGSVRNVPLALVGPAVFLGAVLFALFALPRLADLCGQGTLLTIAIGGFFLFLGLGFMLDIFHQKEDVSGVLVAGIFFLIGALLSGIGIWSLIRGKPPASTT